MSQWSDAILRRFVRITHTASPVNPPNSTTTVHLTSQRRVPEHLVIKVARDWFCTPVRLLSLERSQAADVDVKWELRFEKGV